MLAYRLMKSANLGKDEMLAKVGVSCYESGSMSYQRMKNTLLSMNDGIVQLGSHNKVTPKIKFVKEEPADILYQDEQFKDYIESNDDSQDEVYDNQESDWDESDVPHDTYYQERRNFRPRGSYRGKRPMARPPRYYDSSGRKGKLNRYDTNGKPSACNICSCIYH